MERLFRRSIFLFCWKWKKVLDNRGELPLKYGSIYLVKLI